MPEDGRPPAVVSRMRRRVERTGLLLLLAALAYFLWRAHVLIAWSDPSKWYHFGRHFPERFGETPLAYGFPLLVHSAVQAVGPVWAFLVNLPVLLVLAGLLYVFARSLVPREPALHARLGALAGGVAVALLVKLDRAILIDFVSPYRDPLAHVFVLLSCLLLLHYRNARNRSLVWVAGAAASLALACSTRETSGLMLVPFLVYALASRRDVPLARAVVVFGASFASVCIPMLVHNHGVSGRFWLPAQAAASFAQEGSTIPGVRAAQLGRTLPDVIAQLGAHYGALGLALIAAGLLFAARRRHREILALCLPAFLVYLLFYGSDDRVVDRYLFVFDLFALPVAGAGAAALLHWTLAPLGTGRVARAFTLAAGLLAVLFAAGVALDGADVPRQAFRIEDARAFRNHLAALTPDDAPILSERPLAEMLRCFLDGDERVTALRRRHLFADPATQRRVHETVRTSGAAYFVFHRPAVPRYLRTQFDLEAVATFRASTYGLEGTLERHFFVDRLVPWSERLAGAILQPEKTGLQVLEVDLGRLSSEERSFARLYWNGELLDGSPRDGVNYYTVRVEEPGALVELRLASDRPLPARLDARLRPLRRPIEMDFDSDRSFRDLERLGPAFWAGAPSRYPALRGEGAMDVPTLAREDALFVGVAEVGVRRGQQQGFHELTIGIPERAFYRVRLHSPQAYSPTSANWSRISFAFHEPLVTADDTRLVWRYRGPGSDGERAILAIRSLAIHRYELAPSLRVDVGENDELFLVDGFGVREAIHEPQRLSFRATGRRAELRMPVKPDPRPARLAVSYLTDPRPTSAPAAAPSFTWNGVPLEGAAREEAVGDFAHVTATFELPAELVAGLLHHLVIESNPWRQRGILLDRVTLQRVGSGARG